MKTIPDMQPAWKGLLSTRLWAETNTRSSMLISFSPHKAELKTAFTALYQTELPGYPIDKAWQTKRYLLKISLYTGRLESKKAKGTSVPHYIVISSKRKTNWIRQSRFFQSLFQRGGELWCQARKSRYFHKL